MRKYPAERIRWRSVESSNVSEVGWDANGNMYVIYDGPHMYMYPGVSRQRAVAAAYAKSVGRYINERIKPRFKAVRLV